MKCTTGVPAGSDCPVPNANSSIVHKVNVNLAILTVSLVRAFGPDPFAEGGLGILSLSPVGGVTRPRLACLASPSVSRGATFWNLGVHVAEEI